MIHTKAEMIENIKIFRRNLLSNMNNNSNTENIKLLDILDLKSYLDIQKQHVTKYDMFKYHEKLQKAYSDMIKKKIKKF